MLVRYYTAIWRCFLFFFFFLISKKQIYIDNERTLEYTGREQKGTKAPTVKKTKPTQFGAVVVLYELDSSFDFALNFVFISLLYMLIFTRWLACLSQEGGNITRSMLDF